MRYTFLLAPVAILSLVACTQIQAPSDDSSSSSSSAMDGQKVMHDDGAMNDDTMMDASKGAMMEESDAVVPRARIVDVTVTDWSFTPGAVTVKKGEKVQLRLKGDDGVHSLAVAGLGLNVRVEPGSSTVIDLPTAVAGTFEGRCGVPCGPGHRDMKFLIIIE